MSGMKDRFRASAQGLGESVAKREAESGNQTPRAPITMPGRLAAFSIEAEKYERRIQDLQAKLAQAEAGGSSLLKIADLVETPGRKRKLSPAEYAELKANLSRNPLIHPIVVRKLPNGKYEILAGHNRVQIYRELGRDEIEGKVVEQDDAGALRAAFYSNLLAPALPDFEKFLGFKAMMDATGMSQDEVADDAGISKAHVSKLMRFGDLPAQALEAIAANPHCIGANAVEALASAAKAGKADKVTAAIERLAQDEKFTQQAAIAAATQEAKQAAPRSEPTVFKSGNKKVCEVKIRGGIIGIQFKDESIAPAWRAKIEEFIKSEIEKG